MYQRSALEEKFDMRGANGEMFQLLAITCGNDYFNAKNKRVFFPSQLKDGRNISNHIQWLKTVSKL